MGKLGNVSTALMLDEMIKRDSRIKNRLFDISCTLEKIELIAFNFSAKYNLDKIQLDKYEEQVFLNKRIQMGTELSILVDYILQIDGILKSIEKEEIYCSAPKEVSI